MPGYDGRWTPAAVAYVRVVARLRARGHTLEQIKRASDSGQLAIGPIENLLSGSEARYTLREVVARERPEAGADRAHLRDDGPRRALARTLISEEDLQMMRYVAAVLEAGLPLGRPSCSWCASTGRRSRRSPTPRCA